MVPISDPQPYGQIGLQHVSWLRAIVSSQGGWRVRSEEQKLFKWQSHPEVAVFG